MTVKSCRSCPSFIPEDEARKLFKSPPGADVCARHGHMLSRQNVNAKLNEQIAQQFAYECPDHGVARPANISNIPAAQVAIGDPKVIRSAANGTGLQAAIRPATCNACEHFIPPDKVRSELGWSQAMCAGTGRLIFASRYVYEASACTFGVQGPNRDTTDGVVLLPEYEVSVSISNKKRADYKLDEEVARHAVDPREYVGDVPPNAAALPKDYRDAFGKEAAFGIRAWRRVLDPEGIRKPLFMPIFNGQLVCGFDPRDTYGSHRPDLYVDHQGLLYDLCAELFYLDETPLFIGGAGTGKTETMCWLAWLMDLPFTRISISKGTEDHHLAGEKELVVDEVTGQNVTRWKMGRFSEKWSQPGLIGVDEPNLKEEIYNFLRPAMDNARQLVLDGGQGIICHRGDKTFLVLGQNPAHDPIYVGTEPLSAADLDRVSPIYFGLPSDPVEREIIRKHCADGGYDIDAITLDRIMQIAKDLRQLIADGSLPISWGLRPQIKVARKTQYYSMEKAYRRAVIDGLESAVIDTVLGVVRSVAS